VKVGVLGGTFDPVHNGHLALASHALDGLALDEVLFVPAGEPWRKSHRAITPAVHRLAMLRVAIAGNRAFGISDIELRRDGPTYTADTLEILAGERLDDAFWFIMGADALADLPNWREPGRIFRHAMLAVAPREGELVVDAAALGIPGVVDRVVKFECPRIDVSSSAIRERVAAGADIGEMVPGSVRAYIKEHALYR
jgi:nicotinate-nucleotide adenylyltransferase